MKHSESIVDFNYLAILHAAIPPLAVTIFLWLTSNNSISITQALLALGLLFLPWQSYLSWRQGSKNDLPVFSMISFMYWMYYAMSLFWGDLIIQTARSVFGREPLPELLTEALAMALLGVCCAWLGIKSRVGKALVPRRVPEIAMSRPQRNYIRAVLIVSGSLSVLEPSAYLLGEGGRQLIILSLSFIPLLAFAILFRQYIRKEAVLFDKILVLAFLFTRLLVGLSSGWLGSAASIMVVCAAIYVAERRRVPRLAVASVVVFTLFFQVGKEDFRNVYWTDQAQASQLSRVSFWVNTSLEKWSEALSNPSGKTMSRLLNQSVSRVSLLTQSANVLEQTPGSVPYQNGRLYSYLFISLVPRAIWPDKPIVSDANRFYQVAYGVTAEEDIDMVAIAVGVLTEGYINFGWYGVIGVMFLLGVFLDFYQRTFLAKSSGLLMTSLGIALLPQLLSIESQLAAYVGGLIQQVLFSLIVLLPVVSWRRLNSGSEPTSAPTATSVAGLATN